MKENDPNAEVFEGLLSKYNALWIWSIEFGALSGTVFSLLTVPSFSDNRWGILTALFAVLLGIAAFSAILSSMHLYKCLTGYLIPKLIEGKNIQPRDNPTERFAQNLRSAFFYMIFALGARLLMAISELIIRSLNY